MRHMSNYSSLFRLKSIQIYKTRSIGRLNRETGENLSIKHKRKESGPDNGSLSFCSGMEDTGLPDVWRRDCHGRNPHFNPRGFRQWGERHCSEYRGKPGSGEKGR